MKIRLGEPRAVPDKPNYVAVDLPGRGLHHFRLPTMSVDLRIDEMVTRSESRSAQLEGLIARVGVGWHHETMDLEAVWPEEDTDAAIRAYSRAVQAELEDEGYHSHEISHLYAALQKARDERVAVMLEAIQKADFGRPPMDTESSASSKSRSSGETPQPSSDGTTASA